MTLTIDSKKRIVCLIMCILIIFFVVSQQYQEAHAFAPAIVLAGYAVPEAVVVVGSVLAAAGLTWAADTAIDASCDWFYDTASPAIKQSVCDAINSISNGVAVVSDELWNAARSWVQSNFQVGANSKSVAGTNVRIDGTYYPVSSINPAIGYPITSLTIGGHTYTVNWTEKNWPLSADWGNVIKLYKDGAYCNINDAGGTSSTLYIKNQSAYWLSLEADTDSSVTYVNDSGTPQLNLMINYFGNTDGVQSKKLWQSFKMSSYPELQSQINSSSLAARNISVTGQSVISNANWDIKTADGKRTVAVPSSTTGLVNKTYQDVANPVITYQNSWTGTWATNVPSGTYKFVGTGTIAGEMPGTLTGTWEGTWSTTVTGARTWTGTFTAADATTWTGTATESIDVPISPPASGEINWEPLKVAGNMFTNAFPFSLPWDLKRSFSTLAADGVQPSFDINVPDTKLLKGFKFKVDLSMFNDLLKVARTLELISFDIGLIFLTRKLLGGSV